MNTSEHPRRAACGLARLGWAAGLALLLLTLSCKRQAPEPPAADPVVRLGFQRVGPYRAFFVAQDRGFFRDEHVNVEATEYPSSNLIAQAQVAGRIDGSGFVSFPVLFSLEQASPGQSACQLVVSMTAHSRFAGVVVPAASTLTSPDQLRGRRIGVYPSSTNVIYAQLMLERLFGSRDAATIQQIEPPLALQLLESGGIDALIGPDPMPATAIARGIGRVLVYSPDARFVMDPHPVGCATFSKAFHEQHPDVEARVRRALDRAVDFLRDPANHAEVLRIVAARTGVDASIAPHLGDVDYAKLGELDRHAVQRLADLLERERVLQGHVDTGQLFRAR